MILTYTHVRLIVCMLCATCLPLSQLRADEVVFAVPQFDSLQDPALTESARELMKSHRALISKLESELRRDTCTPHQRATIMHLLAHMNSVQSTSLFIKYIDMKSPWQGERFRVALWSDYPGKDALVRLELHGVYAALRALRTESNPFRRKLMLDVIKEVEGITGGAMKLDEAVSRIDDEIRRATGNEQSQLHSQKTNLVEAKSAFEIQFSTRPK